MPTAALLDLVSPAVLSRKDELRARFLEARPFRHLIVDGFFEEGYCRRLLEEFPAFDEERARNELGVVAGKAVLEDIRSIGPAYRDADRLFADPAFRQLVGHVTGIPDLVFDPGYFGGGTHENRPGQSLDPHVDFNYHPVTGLHRRLNLIVYLNPEWDESWGGSIEIHSDPRSPENVVREYAPLLNRAILFETNERSWHGFKRIRPPADRPAVSRRSLTVYYYSETRPAEEIAPDHTTFYVQRPLPPHIRPGTTLTAEDYDEIQALLKVRDGVVRMHQERDLKLGKVIEGLRHRAASGGVQTVLPLAGELLPGATCRGYHADGWVERELVLEARPARAVTSVRLRGHCPEQLARGLRLTMSAGGRETFRMCPPGEAFEAALLCELPAGEPFTLRVVPHDAFVPRDVIPGNPDVRELSFVLSALLLGQR